MKTNPIMEDFHINRMAYKVPEKERIIKVQTRTVKCDLDHPVVYYSIGDLGYVICGYCDMKYVYSEKGEKNE